jgi:hypothetical protein
MTHTVAARRTHMSTHDESSVNEWIVEEPVDGIVRVRHNPSGEIFEITVADVRGAVTHENEIWAGHLDDYLRNKAIHIAAQRKLLRRGD